MIVGLGIKMAKILKYDAGVLGTTTLWTAVRRFAIAVSPTTAVASMVFGWCVDTPTLFFPGVSQWELVECAIIKSPDL